MKLVYFQITQNRQLLLKIKTSTSTCRLTRMACEPPGKLLQAVPVPFMRNLSHYFREIVRNVGMTACFDNLPNFPSKKWAILKCINSYRKSIIVMHSYADKFFCLILFISSNLYVSNAICPKIV